MRMIWPVIQLPASHCIDKCGVIFERSSTGTPDYLRFRIILHQFRDQNMEGVSDSAAGQALNRNGGKQVRAVSHRTTRLRESTPMAAVTSIPPWRILQAFLSLMAVAGRYSLQSFEPADNS